MKDQDLAEGQGVMGDYIDMHELSRHIIHMSETIQVAAQVATTAPDYIQAYHRPTDQDGIDISNIVSGLRSSAQFLQALKLRSDAFRDRLENEIRFVRARISFLLVAIRDR